MMEVAAGDRQASEGGPGAWKIDPKLESDLLKLFGQADQVDAAFKVGRRPAGLGGKGKAP